jgi:hypothetical protein
LAANNADSADKQGSHKDERENMWKNADSIGRGSFSNSIGIIFICLFVPMRAAAIPKCHSNNSELWFFPDL